MGLQISKQLNPLDLKPQSLNPSGPSPYLLAVFPFGSGRCVFGGGHERRARRREGGGPSFCAVCDCDFHVVVVVDVLYSIDCFLNFGLNYIQFDV